MSGFCTFGFHHPQTPGRRRNRYGVVFTSKEDVSQGLLADRVHSFLQSSPPPDELIVMTHAFSRSALSGLADNPDFLHRLPGRFLTQTPLPVRRAYFDAQGAIHEYDDTADRPFGALGEPLICSGLWEIFQRRKGLLPTSPVHHFVKPSGKHTAQFIRTAQVLVDGGEVDFIASSLLPYLKSTTEYIYCDTASISVLAYALVKLRKCHDPKFVCPVIESFSSYNHVDDYEFLNPSESLFLISASTSGDLARRLITKKGVPTERIVTLFYLGEHPADGELLLDLTDHGNPERRGYSSIVGYKSDDCPFCGEGSSQIALLGDQFLPQSPNVEAILLAAADAPRWLSPFVKKCIGKGIITCHHGIGLRGRVHEQFLHIAPALNRSSAGDPTFGENIRKAVGQSIPASLTRIIHIDDEISRQLALFIRRHFSRRHRAAKVEVVNSRKVTEAPESFRAKSGTVLVVAGCFVTGRSLMELSQVLRNIQENGSIVFFVGLSRCETEEVFKEVRTNVTFTRDRSRNFGFQCVEHIYIPDSTNFRHSVWTDEERFLKSLRLQFAREKRFPMKIVDARLALLGSSVHAGNGLQSELLWPDSEGRTLMLRPNFAFFDFDYSSTPATQAEVFFVMAAVLHNLRCKPGARKSLVQFEHDRRLIAPNSFYRLNDGVVQAALLRAARKAEIDYRVSQAESAAMSEVVNSIFSAWTRPRGEAALEFLLMLAIRQLRLVEADEDTLVRRFRRKLHPTTIGFYLAEHILGTESR